VSTTNDVARDYYSSLFATIRRSIGESAGPNYPPLLTDTERERYAEIAVIFVEALRPVIYEEMLRARASSHLGPMERL
jgi:hypothetical protein